MYTSFIIHPFPAPKIGYVNILNNKNFIEEKEYHEPLKPVVSIPSLIPQVRTDTNTEEYQKVQEIFDQLNGINDNEEKLYKFVKNSMDYIKEHLDKKIEISDADKKSFSKKTYESINNIIENHFKEKLYDEQIKLKIRKLIKSNEDMEYIASINNTISNYVITKDKNKIRDLIEYRLRIDKDMIEDFKCEVDNLRKRGIYLDRGGPMDNFYNIFSSGSYGSVLRAFKGIFNNDTKTVIDDSVNNESYIMKISLLPDDKNKHKFLEIDFAYYNEIKINKKLIELKKAGKLSDIFPLLIGDFECDKISSSFIKQYIKESNRRKVKSHLNEEFIREKYSKLGYTIFENKGLALYNNKQITELLSSDTEKFENFYNSISDFIIALQKNNIVNIDIAERNLLYNKAENKFYMIDFGMTYDFKDKNTLTQLKKYVKDFHDINTNTHFLYTCIYMNIIWYDVIKNILKNKEDKIKYIHNFINKNYDEFIFKYMISKVNSDDNINLYNILFENIEEKFSNVPIGLDSHISNFDYLNETIELINEKFITSLNEMFYMDKFNYSFDDIIKFHISYKNNLEKISNKKIYSIIKLYKNYNEYVKDKNEYWNKFINEVYEIAINDNYISDKINKINDKLIEYKDLSEIEIIQNYHYSCTLITQVFDIFYILYKNDLVYLNNIIENNNKFKKLFENNYKDNKYISKNLHDEIILFLNKLILIYLSKNDNYKNIKIFMHNTINNFINLTDDKHKKYLYIYLNNLINSIKFKLPENIEEDLKNILNNSLIKYVYDLFVIDKDGEKQIHDLKYIITKDVINDFKCEIDNIKNLDKNIKINRNNSSIFSFYNILGSGSYGLVVSTCENDDCDIDKYVLKIEPYDKKNPADSSYNNEVQINQYLNVIKFNGHPKMIGNFNCDGINKYISNEFIKRKIKIDYENITLGYILFEHAGKDLTKINISELKIKNLFTIITNLHDLGIIHFDLAFRNIYCKNNNYKIGDYGLAVLTTSNEFIEIFKNINLENVILPVGQYSYGFPKSNNSGTNSNVNVFNSSDKNGDNDNDDNRSFIVKLRSRHTSISNIIDNAYIHNDDDNKDKININFGLHDYILYNQLYDYFMLKDSYNREIHKEICSKEENYIKIIDEFNEKFMDEIFLKIFYIVIYDNILKIYNNQSVQYYNFNSYVDNSLRIQYPLYYNDFLDKIIETPDIKDTKSYRYYFNDFVLNIFNDIDDILNDDDRLISFISSIMPDNNDKKLRNAIATFKKENKENNIDINSEINRNSKITIIKLIN